MRMPARMVNEKSLRAGPPMKKRKRTGKTTKGSRRSLRAPRSRTSSRRTLSAGRRRRGPRRAYLSRQRHLGTSSTAKQRRRRRRRGRPGPRRGAPRRASSFERWRLTKRRSLPPPAKAIDRPISFLLLCRNSAPLPIPFLLGPRVRYTQGCIVMICYWEVEIGSLMERDAGERVTLSFSQLLFSP